MMTVKTRQRVTIMISMINMTRIMKNMIRIMTNMKNAIIIEMLVQKGTMEVGTDMVVRKFLRSQTQLSVQVMTNIDTEKSMTSVKLHMRTWTKDHLIPTNISRKIRGRFTSKSQNDVITKMTSGVIKKVISVTRVTKNNVMNVTDVMKKRAVIMNQKIADGVVIKVPLQTGITVDQTAKMIVGVTTQTKTVAVVTTAEIADTSKV